MSQYHIQGTDCKQGIEEPRAYLIQTLIVALSICTFLYSPAKRS